MTVAGEITEGFKITEVGELPYDWGVTTIDSLNKEDKESINPIQYPSEIFEYYSIPAYQENKTPLLTKGNEILSQKLLLKRGTVLFGKLNPRVEKVWIVKSESSHRKIGSTEWLPILPNKNEADSDFIYYLSWSDYVMLLSKTLVAGSTPSRQRVDPQSFYKIKVPLPPLPEQKKIASVLSAVQEAKEKTENVINALKEVKKSMMKHLFTYGSVSIEDADKVPLKETEIGMIPEHWELVKLGDVTNIKTSFPTFNQIADLDTKDANHEKVLALKVSDMNASGNEKYISEATISFRYSGVLLKKYLKPYSVVFPKRGGAIGTNKKRITTCYSILDPNLIAVEPSDNVNRDYLFAFFDKFDLKSIQHNTPIPQLNKNDVERILFPYPSLKEQQQIAETLSGMDKMIEAESNKRNSLDILFKTLLSLLMTGKIRVKDLEIPV